MGGNREYRIGELAEATGVTRRTIHYYVGRGLLPAPSGAGLATTYSDEHFYRILLIKKMQEAYLPLDEIRRRLAVMNLAEVKGTLEEGVIVEQAPVIAEAPLPPVGSRYERINLGENVELHFPAEASPKVRELVEQILRLVESLSREV